MTRDSSVVLPAPLQPARPITFISILRATGGTGLGFADGVLYIGLEGNVMLACRT